MPSKKPRFSFGFELLLCVLVVLLFNVVYFWEHLLFYIADITERSVFADVLDIVIKAAVFGIVIIAGLKIQKKTLSSVCFFKKASPAVWGSVVVFSTGFVLFYYYITFLFYSFFLGWDTDFETPEGSLLVNIIETALIPAVAEELLFKGLIVSSLEKHHSRITAIVITSLLFAASHLSIVRFVPLFLFSCCTFWIYYRTGSILLPMLIHFMNNLFTMVLVSEPFASVGTFFSALVLCGAGFLLLRRISGDERMKKGALS